MFDRLYREFRRKLHDIRPFLRTKTGSRLALLFIAEFILLFFAPLFHGFVGTALIACVAAVYLILIWRRHDREHAIVPAVFLTVPMLLDMAIYHTLPVVSCLVVAVAAIYVAALSPVIGFFDKLTDAMYVYLTALGICVAVVVAASLLMVLVSVAWWILCIIAFLVVIAVFFGVVFSTAAYTASDGRRQARRREEEQIREQQYRSYRPRQRDTKIYNLDEDDFRDVE